MDTVNLSIFYQWIRNIANRFTRRLANKLALVFSLIVSMFIILLIMISYWRTIDTIKADFIDNNKSILKLVGQSLDNYIQQVDEFSVSIRKDQGNRLINILIDNYDDYQSNTYIEDQIRGLFNTRQDIEEVRFYIPSLGKEFFISRSYANVRVRNNTNNQEAEWYKKATAGRYFRYIEPGLSKENGRAFFSFHRALINLVGKKTLAVVSISFNDEMMRKINWNEYSQSGEILLVFDSSNQLFYCSSSELKNSAELDGVGGNISKDAVSGNFNVRIDIKDYLTVYAVSDQIGWRTAKLIPLNILSHKVQRTRDLSLGLGIVFIVLFVTLIIFISNIITRSLNRLSRQMEKVGEGNFRAKAMVRGNDETAQLADTFNYMVQQIDELVNEKYIAKINEKTAQLKALEAQINPHFLYNSLQAIASRAVLNGNREISKMIEAMAYNLRYCIKGGDMVKVSDEMKHINNFLILHKARFEDRLNVEVVVEEGTPDVMIPKLSIHTLVENAIKHCLEQITGSITIKVHSYLDNESVIVKVTDDGPGMTDERLHQVKNDLDQTKWLDGVNEHIGLKNLNARLKLMYDGNARLELSSSPHLGTEIRMVIHMNNPVDK